MTRRLLAPITLLLVACVSGQTQDDGAGGSAPGGVAGYAGSSTTTGAAAGAGVGGSAAGFVAAGGSASGASAIGGSSTSGGSPLGGAGGASGNGGMPMGGMPVAGMSMGGMLMGGNGGAPMGGAPMGGMSMGGNGGAPMGGAPMGGSGGASCMETGRMVGMTAAHNAARAMEGANLKPLTWDCTVAAYAQNYANKLRDEQGCWNLVHSGGPYGENLYASGSKPNPPNQTPQAPVDSWYGEKKNYDYAANTCSDVCGHYTQVVWGSTERLGCGVATCPANADGWLYEVWVCDYDPPGNFNGARPY